MTGENELEEYRREKDEFFRTDAMSPLPRDARAGFDGLAYYPEDPAFAFVIEPEPYDEPETVTLQTSDGRARTYERWARLPFTVDGQDVALTVYVDEDAGHLFLPFQDTTSGAETYGAGRYLELPLLEDGRVLLDFNYAYHPFCAYNPTYSCPLPPAENRLPVAIRAGERNP
jgi:uncharacterized protein